ncbi:YcjF family protein [Vagococcus fluvialis]|uniref:YcjF family protein n=1 Tax=Vagococcus fluvialis TaxID=2738 RepID=UPI003D0B5DA6
MQINTDKMAQDLVNAINEKVHNLTTLNIAIIGKSGVGKSTLINSLFRENFAETGLGRPVTQEIRKISKKNYPLAIYDTPGFELSNDQQDKVKDELLELINEGYNSKDVNDAIHCVWYCVNVGGNRTFDSSEIEWLKEFTESNKKTKVPIMVVLTQAIPKNKAIEMKSLVEKENLDIVKVVPVLAQDMEFDEDYTARSYGLDNLIDIMTEVLPTELQETLQNVQIASLKAKKKASQAVVATAVAAAFGEGFSPIPFSDAALLVPTQVGMISGITVIFGMDVSKSFLTGFVSSAIGASGTTILGKTLVSNLLKFIPGVGTVAGGVISGTTASLLTTALGLTYIQIMEMIFKGEMTKEAMYTSEGKEKMTNIFKEQLAKQKSKKITE